MRGGSRLSSAIALSARTRILSTSGQPSWPSESATIDRRMRQCSPLAAATHHRVADRGRSQAADPCRGKTHLRAIPRHLFGVSSRLCGGGESSAAASAETGNRVSVIMPGILVANSCGALNRRSLRGAPPGYRRQDVIVKDRACFRDRPALLTPFRDRAFDADAFARLVDWQVREGSSALVPCGTTGKARPWVRRTLPDRHPHRSAAGRIPVIVTAARMFHRHRGASCAMRRRLNAAAALIVAPYYNRPSQAGMIASRRWPTPATCRSSS